MESIEKLLMQILESQNKTNKHLEKLELKLNNNIEAKLNCIFNQTANLIEFQTYTKTKLDNLSHDLNFLTNKKA